MKTLVVNLFSGPGAGKSTVCAGLFYELKCRGVNVEMALEYAKDIIWDENVKKLDNQIYVFAKQHHRMTRINGKVDVMITDAPLILSAIYDKSNNDIFHKLILSESDKFDNLNLYVRRHDAHYDTTGRIQKDVGEAKLIDNKLDAFLIRHNIGYLNMSSTQESVQDITDFIIAQLNRDKDE